MRIRVDDIPPQGRTVTAGLDTSWARKAATEALDAEPTVLVVQVRVAQTDTAKHIAVALEIDAEAPGLCDRCGEDLVRAVSVRSQLVYQPESTESSEEEVELGEDDLDVGWYRDELLSLPDILMEAVALELPSRVLCTDTEACEARTRALLDAASEGVGGHPAFAALKNLKN